MINFKAIAKISGFVLIGAAGIILLSFVTTFVQSYTKPHDAYKDKFDSLATRIAVQEENSKFFKEENKILKIQFKQSQNVVHRLDSIQSTNYKTLKHDLKKTKTVSNAAILSITDSIYSAER